MTHLHLRTERLWLRPVAGEDVPALHALFLDPAVRRWLLDGVAREVSFTRELVAASEARFATRGFGHWRVAEASEGPLIGLAGLSPLEEGEDVELLYALAPARWGRGLASEATRAVLAFGFERCGLPRILARIDLPNGESRRLAERLGMTLLGEQLVDGTPLAHYALRSQAFQPPPGEQSPGR